MNLLWIPALMFLAIGAALYVLDRLRQRRAVALCNAHRARVGLPLLARSCTRHH